jgi:hypothetical protein
MAMFLKDRYELVTLRCWVGFVDDPARRSVETKNPTPRLVVRSQLYRGGQRVGEQEDTPFERLGLTRPGGYARRGATPDLAGTPIGAQLKQAAGMVDSIVWLHIPQDSFQLALLPWEEMVGHVARCSLLRIANFVEEAYKPTPHPTLAICTSQPNADGCYVVADYVKALLRSIDDAASLAIVRPAVHIFTDDRWLPQVRNAAGAPDAPYKALEIKDIPAPPSGPPPGKRTAPRTSSPWLQWMMNYFSGRVVDVMHFISPGYYDGHSGAIALAERPDLNFNEGDFIDAAELTAFYDRLGCSVMAFSSPDMTAWEWGQRMLAFELSWIRPGPILVFEHDHTKYHALTGNYALLFGAGVEAFHQEVETYLRPHLTCHPQLLEQAYFGAADYQQGEGVTNLASKRIDLARAKLAPRPPSMTERPLSMTEEWKAKGEAEALNFLSSIVEI